MSDRKVNLSFSELLEKLMLCQLKENHGGNYAQEIKDVIHDIQLYIDKGVVTIDGKMIRAIIALAQINSFIWQNEDNARNGTPENNNLWFTHQLNANRSEARAVIENMFGGKPDPKLNYMGSIWNISW